VPDETAAAALRGRVHKVRVTGSRPLLLVGTLATAE
jgi:hypothetical protein